MKWNRWFILKNMFLILLIILPTMTVSTSCDSDSQQEGMQKYSESEIFLDEYDTHYQLDATLVESSESLFINFTVLESSTSSVLFKHIPDIRVDWVPKPLNYTLSPSESCATTFYLNSSAVGGADHFSYLAYLTT